jgi:hypothetical protein
VWGEVRLAEIAKIAEIPPQQANIGLAEGPGLPKIAKIGK